MVNVNRILQTIEELDLVRKLRLTTGNCGCFAIALRRLLKDGNLFAIGHGAHVVLQVSSLYIDGTGIYSKEELMENWGGWGSGRVHNDEEDIIEWTSNYHTPEEMVKILKLLSEGKSVRRYHLK